MKKISLYIYSLLVIAGLSACDEDFKDWADPQSTPQLDPAEQTTAVFAAGKDATIVVDDHDLAVDSVDVVKLVSITAEEGSTVSFKILMLNDKHSVPFKNDNGTLRVSLAKLDSLTQEAYQSRASVERELKLSVQAAATTLGGEGMLLSGNDVTVKLKPGATPEVDPNGYYVVGKFKGWNAAGAIAMEQDPENSSLFTLEVEATEAETNFKFFPNAAITNDIDWSAALGCAKDGSTSREDFIYWKVGKDPGALMIEKAGKVKITLDVTNFRYTIADVVTYDLYMTGSAYGWGDSPANWQPLISVNGAAKSTCWGIFYFAAGDKVKFAPKPAWEGDFGFDETIISQASIDLASLSADGSNIVVGKAGWYLVYVSSVDGVNTVEFEAPIIYLTGDCSDGWDVFDDARKFTVPADGTGEFVSPAFVKDGKVRMCVRPTLVDSWWKAEFNVIDGKIAYRGEGGDQPAVPGTTGQKVHLNFGSGDGKIQ